MRTRRALLAGGAGALAALAGCSSLNPRSGSGESAQRSSSGLAVRVRPTGDVGGLDSLSMTVDQVGLTPRGRDEGALRAGDSVDLLANDGDPVEFFVVGFPTGEYTDLSLDGGGGTATADGEDAPARFADGALTYDVDYRLRANTTTVVTAGVAVTRTDGAYALAADPDATAVTTRDGRPETTER